MTLQGIIDVKKCGLFDALKFIAFSVPTITREERVARSQHKIFASLTDDQKIFIEFILDRYISSGVEELGEEKLPEFLQLRYNDLSEDLLKNLGVIQQLRSLFFELQKELYGVRAA